MKTKNEEWDKSIFYLIATAIVVTIVILFSVIQVMESEKKIDKIAWEKYLLNNQLDDAKLQIIHDSVEYDRLRFKYDELKNQPPKIVYKTKIIKREVIKYDTIKIVNSISDSSFNSFNKDRQYIKLDSLFDSSIIREKKIDWGEKALDFGIGILLNYLKRK